LKLEAKADVNQESITTNGKGDDGCATALHIAIQHNRVDCIRLLIESAAHLNPNMKQNGVSFSLMDVAIANASHEVIHILQKAQK